MAKSYRLVSLGVFAAFGTAIAGHFAQGAPAPDSTFQTPALLPTAHANPAEIAFEDTLHRGETLSELLQRSEVAEADAKALLAEMEGLSDPRRLLPGSVVAYRKAYGSGDLRGMELRLDADRTLSVQRNGEAWAGEVAEVPVHTDTVVLAGGVESSLYAALLKDDASGVPAEERERIADILADRIFAWQIDFSRDLRSGDQFRILYERDVRPDGTARDGRVLGVQFSINGREHDAFWFRSRDGSEDYYDADGESLRRAFLRAPLEFRRITSAFTRSRFHPILKRSRPHQGIDYAAASGTRVRAVGDGVIAKAGSGGGYGNVIEIRHKRGYSSRYAHLKGFAKGVRAGTHVRQGDVVGYVGSTGLATGPHLHYEFHANGRAVDPNTIKFITGDPVPRTERGTFRSAVALQTERFERAGGSARLAAAPAAPAPIPAARAGR